MKLQSIIPMSVVFLGLAAIPSLAGETYVSNSSSWQVNCGKGYSESTFNETYAGSRLAVSAAIKLETGHDYQGVGYDGPVGVQPIKTSTESHDSSYGSIPVSYSKGYDYFAASGSLNVEEGKFESKTHAFSYQNTNSYGGSESHKVASGFSY